MLRRFVCLWFVTAIFAGAIWVAIFLREMAHSAPGYHLAFIARASSDLMKMLAVETALYIAACLLVLWRVKKS